MECHYFSYIGWTELYDENHELNHKAKLFIEKPSNDENLTDTKEHTSKGTPDDQRTENSKDKREGPSGSGQATDFTERKGERILQHPLNIMVYSCTTHISLVHRLTYVISLFVNPIMPIGMVNFIPNYMLLKVRKKFYTLPNSS